MKSNWLSILAIVLSLLSILLTATGTGADMQFSTLIEKMVNGETLTALEKQQLVLEARKLEQAEAILTSLIVPGTQNLRINNLTANNISVDNGAITIDEEITINDNGVDQLTIGEDGLWIENQLGAIGFKDTNGDKFNLYMFSDSADNIGINSDIAGAGIIQYITLNNGTAPVLYFRQDTGQNNRTLLQLEGGVQGARLTLEDDADHALIDFRVEGSNGGSTFMRMVETTNTPPGGSTDAYHMYMKGDKLIIQYNELGTAHYFYLDLTATTDQSWIYSATAP